MKQLFVAVIAVVFFVSDGTTHNAKVPKHNRPVFSVAVENNKPLVPKKWNDTPAEAELLHSELLFSNY